MFGDTSSSTENLKDAADATAGVGDHDDATKDATNDAGSVAATAGSADADDDAALEKELMEEIESFELVSGGSTATGETDDKNWEAEIEEMLEQE